VGNFNTLNIPEFVENAPSVGDVPPAPSEAADSTDVSLTLPAVFLNVSLQA
jgi:hypothetical protein